MSDQLEQKPQEMTTNYEPAIEPSQTQNETVVIIEHTIHESISLVTQNTPSSVLESHNQAGSEPNQQLQLTENINYQNFNDEPSETVENHEYEDQRAYQQNFNEQHFQTNGEGFDQFNEVDHGNEEARNEILQEQQKHAQKLSNVITQEKSLEQIKLKQSVYSFASYQNQSVNNEKPLQLEKNSIKVEEKPAEILQKKQQKQIVNSFAAYQNQSVTNEKPLQQEKHYTKIEEKPVKIEQKKQQKVKEPTKKKSKKKKDQQFEPLPVIGAESEEGKKQILSDKKIEENNKVESSNANNNQGQNNNECNDNKPQMEQKVILQQVNSSRVSEIKEQVSQIIDASSVSAGLIIFEAQRQRIGSTLDQFLKYITKHEKHTSGQKQLINNVEEEIQKKKQSKTSLCNNLREYFEDYVNLCKSLYERSYKYTKSEKALSVNPMINMKEQLKAGVDELIFLRKSTGNQYNRLGDFIAVNTQKNVVKLFTDYWKAVDTAQLKYKEKKDEFHRKEKQLTKRIAKVIKVYTKGKQGISQEQDLFVEMTKFINEEKDYRTLLIQYGLGLIPLKKAFIKAEQVLYEELQVLFNGFKNQFRSHYSIHPKEFTQIQKLQKQIKQKNTFEKLSDITDGDYVRSVLLTLQKATIQELTDKQFEKVLNLLHFEEIMGNSVDLLKGTTSKAFELKNKAEQVVDTVSGNLLIFNKQSAQMKEKFIIKNINAKIVQEGVVQIDEVIKGLIFNSNRTVRITFRDNDRAEELICFLNQVHESIQESEAANNKK